MSFIRPVVHLAAVLLTLLGGPAVGQEAPGSAAPPPSPPTTEAPAPAAGGISVELNKLEVAGNICQAYFVLQNGLPEHVGELQADVFLFDKEGVVLRGLILPFADIAPGRTTVAIFDLADLPCGDIGRVLLNRVVGCTKPDGAAIEGCADRLSATSRAETPFSY